MKLDRQTPMAMEPLRERISAMVMEYLAQLDWDVVSSLSHPKLRLETSLHDGNSTADTHPSSVGACPWSPRATIANEVQHALDLCDYLQRPSDGPDAGEGPSLPSWPRDRDDDAPDDACPDADIWGPLARMADHGSEADDSTRAILPKATSSLRPARDTASAPVSDDSLNRRRIHVTDKYPKRVKLARDGAPVPQERHSADKLIVGIWEQIHGGISLEPHSLLEQWRLAASAVSTSLQDGDSRLEMDAGRSLPCPPAAMNDLSPAWVDKSAFNSNNMFCRKVTQASRASRAVEVIVQARWTECFDAHVDSLALTLPALSPTKRRKTALLEACADFGWSEKELRNKMAVWRGYKQIKDAVGWAALVFAGMGLYRFCKYRHDFNPDSIARLRAYRSRIELAADTLHPTWRQLLLVVGEKADRRFSGHPHDWVVETNTSDPVPLRSTYLELDPSFSFEHIQVAIVDSDVWDEDPRWTPPPDTSAAMAGRHICHTCGQEQSEDPTVNCCYCFPSHFAAGHQSPSPVQIYKTADGRRNGLLALCGFARGSAIGEFLGLVTEGLENVDVLHSSMGGRQYQIWQGRYGNFTRFVNHSCKPNAQFQEFVWLGLQRIMLVSKGVEAGEEVTVDYSRSYWEGLDKECLCGEACCQHGGN